MAKESLTNLGEMIASRLHEDWRKTRLNQDGTYEPRWKKVRDENFISSLDQSALPSNVRVVDGAVEIDIANSSYDQLSEDWKAENKAAGHVVARIIESGEQDLDVIGSIIHDEWLKRNSWAKGGKLDVPFSELPVDEQEKDLDQYKIGLDAAINGLTKSGPIKE